MLCLIFDVDDTVVEYVDFDFDEWYRFVALSTAKKLGMPLTIDIWKNMINGKIGRDYPERFGISYKKFWKEFDERNLEYRKMMLESGRLRLYDDAEIIKDLPGKKIAWSASSSNCVNFVLKNLNVVSFFNSIYGKDFEDYRYAILEPKYPLLLEIIKREKCEECYVVGDSERDVLSAEKAGCKAIFLNRKDDKKMGDITIKSLRELKEIIQFDK